MARGSVYLSLTLLALLTAYTTNEVYGQSLTPSGKISIESNSIALAVGVNWGEGRLSFKGKRALFGRERSNSG